MRSDVAAPVAAWSDEQATSARPLSAERRLFRAWARGHVRAQSRLARVALSGKRVVVTGGAGFIGTTLARRLVDDNEIVALDNLHRDTLGGTALADHPNFTFVEGDVLRPRPAPGRSSQARPTSSTARGSPEWTRLLASPVRTMFIDVVGTYNVLEAALAAQETVERLVDFSTSEVFGQRAFNVPRRT